MCARSFARLRVLNAALRGVVSAPEEVKYRPIHISARDLKKKKTSYNKYLVQLHKQKQIYLGFAYEILERQNERSTVHSEEIDDEDFEQELLSEGRKRRSAYRYAKKVREHEKGPGPRLLTWDQMEHVRFLRQADPEEWDVRTLAHSFQVPELVIRKVLRSKKILGPLLREKLDAKARTNQGVFKLPHASEDETNTSLTTVEESRSLSTEGQWGLPDWKNPAWFSGYENAIPSNKGSSKPGNSGQSLPHRSSNKDGVSWLDDEETEFYEYMYRNEEQFDEENGVDNGEDIHDTEDNDADVVSSEDGINFYDNLGDLVYRV